MSSKMNQIPFLSSYEDVRAEMNRDLQYRLNSRTAQTSLGRPLYYRINVQMITTQECPFHCPFCLERQNPMSGDNDFEAQIEALKRVLSEHPDARLLITGGEPGLYPEHIAHIVQTYKDNCNYAGKHARVTLGDMWQQRHNDYGDGYSNIIIHPDGRITTNWK